MPDTYNPDFPTQNPGSVADMIKAVADRMRRHMPKTDEEIDALYGSDCDDDDEDRPLYRLSEQGIEEQIDATVERRGLQKMW